MLTCRYQSSSKIVRLTFGLERIRPSRALFASMLTTKRPSSQSYHVATVIGNPSGRIDAMIAAFGRLRNSTTSGGKVSTLRSRAGDHCIRAVGQGAGRGAADGQGGDRYGQ